MATTNLNQLYGKLQRKEQNRVNDADRVASGLASPISIEGTFLVDGSGEASADIVFPVKFIERPNISFGGELHLDTNPVAGQFPTISVVVNRWITDPPAALTYTVATLKLYFVGAQLLVVTTGPTSQRMWVHWTAKGRAIINPAALSDLTTNSPI